MNVKGRVGCKKETFQKSSTQWMWWWNCILCMLNSLNLIHFSFVIIFIFFFEQVTKYDHRYLKSEEMREEGGTPAIVESIRAGLVFQLKQAVGVENIMNREHILAKFEKF